MVGIGGSGLITFIKQYEQARGKIEGDKFMGNVFWPDPLVLAEIGEQLEGGVAGAPTAGDSTEEAAVAWSQLVDETYPVEGVQGTASSIFTYTYWANMDAALQALEQVNADLSDGHAAFREALQGVTVKGGYGDITLDENRQAVLDNYVQQVVATDDGFGVKTILRIPAVEQTFGGVFTADTPSVDRENPQCVPLDPPPPWVGNAEELNFGG
jgi:branched-chain amino acid transport system substrate-binding protein